MVPAYRTRSKKFRFPQSFMFVRHGYRSLSISQASSPDGVNEISEQEI